jgi:hypothetical protein
MSAASACDSGVAHWRLANPFILPIRALRRYVASNDAEAPLPLEDALVLLDEAEEARTAADVRLNKVMRAIGIREPASTNIDI